jgi:hypothetical protein
MSGGVTVEVPKMARRCENCACYMEVKNPANPMEHQGFCRRDPATATPVRVNHPRLKPDGTPVLDRQDRPIMEQRQDMAYIFRATARELTCFDGWRPLGTEPGDEWLLNKLRRADPPLTPPAAND